MKHAGEEPAEQAQAVEPSGTAGKVGAMDGRVRIGTMVIAGLAVLLVAVAIVAFVLAFRGENPDDGSGDPTTPGTSVVLTVEQALAAEEGQELNVTGAVVATADQTVLASALAESYPPQAGGAILPVEGLDLAALVGLTSTAGQAGVAEVTWSDYWMVLSGRIEGGVLRVEGTPRVEENTSIEDVRMRFSPVSEPISSGDQVWWAFDLTNTGGSPVELVFSSGQHGEVILSQGGADVYRWSEGKAFTEAIETVTLEAGGSYSVVLNDTLDIPAGDYQLVAQVPGAIGPAGAGVPLPELSMTLTVH